MKSNTYVVDDSDAEDFGREEPNSAAADDSFIPLSVLAIPGGPFLKGDADFGNLDESQLQVVFKYPVGDKFDNPCIRCGLDEQESCYMVLNAKTGGRRIQACTYCARNKKGCSYSRGKRSRTVSSNVSEVTAVRNTRKKISVKDMTLVKPGEPGQYEGKFFETVLFSKLLIYLPRKRASGVSRRCLRANPGATTMGKTFRRTLRTESPRSRPSQDRAPNGSRLPRSLSSSNLPTYQSRQKYCWRDF